MSSTNRSNARDKHISDYYVTPIDRIVKFLAEFSKHEDVLKSECRILDPCSGGDEFHLMSYPEALKQIGVNNANITTVDIRKDSLAEIKEDYLSIELKNRFNVIITNPPFNLAREIIEKAMDDVNDNGFVIMLLRLNFLEGKSRLDLWQRQLPKYIFVHSARMSFTDDGKTDSVAYAHYCFQKGYNPEFCKVKVII